MNQSNKLKKLTKLVFVLSFLFCTCKISSAPKFRNVLFNDNGTENVYFIKVIEITDHEFIIDNDRNIYMISNPKSTVQLSKNSILSDKNAFIVCQELFGEMLFLYLTNDEFMSYNQREYEYEELYGGFSDKIQYKVTNRINDNFSAVDFEMEAKYFMLVLMTGSFYNHLKYEIWMDWSPINKPLDFPDMEAYYKVAVPLWIHPKK